MADSIRYYPAFYNDLMYIALHQLQILTRFRQEIGGRCEHRSGIVSHCIIEIIQGIAMAA